MSSIDRNEREKIILEQQMNLRALTPADVRFDICRDLLQIKGDLEASEDSKEKLELLYGKMEDLLSDGSYIALRLRRNYALQMADEARLAIIASYPETLPSRRSRSAKR